MRVSCLAEIIHIWSFSVCTSASPGILKPEGAAASRPWSQFDVLGAAITELRELDRTLPQ
jgi:hypothetical protein